jgi:hypothetical protein
MGGGLTARLGNHTEQEALTLMPMEKYRALVTRLADAAEGTTFFNEGVAHARIVIENIFRVSNEEVDILSADLASDVYGDRNVIDSAKLFLTTHPNSKLCILTGSETSDNNPFLAALRNAQLRDRVELSRVPARKLETVNFQVGDGRHFRFQADATKLNAICRFGDATLGASLQSRFKAAK